MNIQETILCSTGPSSSTAGPGTITLHNIQTGVSLASFKQTNAASHSTAFVQSKNVQGGFILAAQPDKSILNVYNFQRDQIALKIVLPEKLSCVTVDRNGDYCAGGTAQGRIYLWEIASGIMYNSWDAHYRRVTVLRFTADGAALISGSEDSGVSVWPLSTLLDDDLQNDLSLAYCTLSDHTLPITEILCGVGSFPECRVLTSSLDHAAKMWDLSSKTLLSTFQYPQPITCLAWDTTERLFFAASEDGSIHQTNLFQENSRMGSKGMEAVGGGGVSDIIRVGDDNAYDRRRRLISVGQPVGSLAISMTSSLLLVGTLMGLIHVYDISSHQLLRTISTHKGLQINYLATLIKPTDLVGNVSLSLNLSAGSNTADARDVFSVKPFLPLQRTRDLKARESHEVSMILPVHHGTSTHTAAYSSEELYRDHAFFVSPATTSAASDPASLQAKVATLEDEIRTLKEQLGKAKGVNDLMWENVVQKVVGGASERKKRGGDDMDVDERPEVTGSARKKGRS